MVAYYRILTCLLTISAVLGCLRPQSMELFAAGPGETALKAQIRRPVAIVAAGRFVFVGNQRSGTVSVIEPASRRVVAEHRVAGRIADMAVHPGAADVFVLDSSERQLLAVTCGRAKPTVETVAKLGREPAKLAVSTKLHRVFVTMRWARRVAVVDFDPQFQKATRSREVQLPFPPGALLLFDGERRLFVADAFGGRIAIVNTSSLKIERSETLLAHNIRGLAQSVDGSKLYVTHQRLAAPARSDFDDVHWGVFMVNSLSVLDVKSLLDKQRDPLAGGWVERLGRTGQAAGDPGPILIDAKGRLAVAISGTSRVVVRGTSYGLQFPTGRRPSAMTTADDRLYVANQFDESVSVFDVRRGDAVGSIELGPRPKLSAADRGEFLFFDASLSHDGWMSCNSCHSDGHTVGLLADTLGDGNYGAPKRIPSLLGTRGTGPWAWNGSMKSLDQQIRQSTTSTMHGAELTDQQTADLVAYLETLKPPPSAAPSPKPLINRGQKVFDERGCVRCHRPPAYTSAGTFHVGLEDEAGRRKFNPPSLLGLGQRDVFFHDGRAQRLEDIVQRMRHQLQDDLSADDAEVLIAFLRSL